MFKNRNRGRKGKNTSMENMYELIAPCHFGLESVLKREILDLGYEIVTVEDGRITFRGDVTAIARANIFIRTAERILLKMGSFRATDFDELFEGTKAIPWEEFLPRDAKFWVTKATTNKSALFSASAIQSIVKKAIVERMKQTYRVERFEEDGTSIRFVCLSSRIRCRLVWIHRERPCINEDIGHLSERHRFQRHWQQRF